MGQIFQAEGPAYVVVWRLQGGNEQVFPVAEVDSIRGRTYW